ncbi:MAG: PrsW family intramembrane metalloprotease [Euryarchaeota archaeon]|nr:PrsW family intramembrane metalloprotease [Euryarchaeota archaeon]
MAISTLEIVAVILAALIPSLLYMIWIRNTELSQREPLPVVSVSLLYGGTAAFGGAFLLETVLVIGFLEDGNILNRFLWGMEGPSPEISIFILAVIIAPFVEEFLKAGGVFVVSKRLNELENGMIYGAAIGLGFAAVENVLYFSDALLVGLEVFIATAILRTLTSTLLHASATAVSGYGIARSRLFRQMGRRSNWISYVLIAVTLHAAFNFFAIAGQIFASGMDVYLLGLVASLTIATVAFRMMRVKIRQLDATSPTGR